MFKKLAGDPDRDAFDFVPDAGPAPLVYFDLASAQGAYNGSVQIELSARAVDSDEAQLTARLRCSPQAAMALRRSIDTALNRIGVREIVLGGED